MESNLVVVSLKFDDLPWIGMNDRSWSNRVNCYYEYREYNRVTESLFEVRWR